MMRRWRLDSLSIALKHRLGYRKFFTCSLTYKSDGQRIMAAAELLRIPLATFSEQLAIDLGYPYLASVPPFSLSLLPRRIGFAELRRLEFVPLSSQGAVTGIVCLNPSKISEQFPEWASTPIFLATPNAIFSALELSEQSLGSFPAIKTPQRDELILDVIERMMGHTLALGEQLFFVRETMNQLAYEVRPRDKTLKRGFIAGAIASEVLELCAEHALNRKSLSLNDGKGFLTITLADDASEYCIRKVEQLSISHSKEEVLRKPISSVDPMMNDTATVFIVDDNRDFLRVLEKFLSRANFKVCCFSSAAQAIQHIDHTNEWPQVLVTDLHMPMMSGMEFVEELSHRYNCDLPPILFLTSDDSIDSEIDALKRGAVGFIPKSRDPRLLVAHLERICANIVSRKAA